MKKILIISKKLNSGGVEVSLLNFIKYLKKDKNIYIKLLLLKNEGPYFEEFNSMVDIDEIEFNDETYNTAIDILNSDSLKKRILKYIIKFLDKSNFSFINNCLVKKTKRYDGMWDLVIDFHGYGYLGTTYMVKNINANVKCSFIHDEKIAWMKKNKFIMNDIDYFLAVSNHCANIFKKKYKKLSKKVKIMHNILDEEKIVTLSNESINYFENGFFNILTIGRLTKQKGYYILIDTARKLKQKNINFKWYIIGAGNLKKKLQYKIKKYHLEENIVLLGLIKNPYPYIKQCDLYVQPSIHEGYGIAIAEARILEKPIVASNLKPIAEQIKNNYTGFLCDVNYSDFFQKICLLYNNKNLMLKMSENLKKENNMLTNDIDVIYSIMEE